MNGIIIKALSGFYYVGVGDTVITCKARGSFRKNGISPLVGDKVEIDCLSDGSGVISELLPRSSCFLRPPVANIDKLFIISSFSYPAPNALIIDKLTVIAEYSGVEPVIVFNKCDTGDFSEWKKIYEKSGFKTFVISASKGFGFEELQTELKDCVSAFTGNSGVGKSSILNKLLEDDLIPTGDVSEKLGRGRHTTRHTQLYALPFGGYVADTPGFSSLEDAEPDYELKEKLPDLFREFREYEGMCRFTSCMHTGDRGCAIANAVREGKIEKTRYESYLSLYEELKSLKPWNEKKHK